MEQNVELILAAMKSLQWTIAAGFIGLVVVITVGNILRKF